MIICLRTTHYILCSFTNIISRRESVGDIRWPSDSGDGKKYRPEFIRCVDGRQPEIHEVWTVGEDDFSPEVHPTDSLVSELLLVNVLVPITLL